MSLLTAELRKVWGNRVFPMLLAVLVAANLLLLSPNCARSGATGCSQCCWPC